MNKKGFTLIELIAVVVIISLLSIIVVPTVINQFANKKEEISKLTQQLIIDAAELYAQENHKYNKIITLNDLVKDEKIESPIKDNKTGKEIPLSKKIKIDKKGSACIVGIDECDETLEIDEYKEEILNGTDPVLNGQLVPVTIANNGTVKKADISTEWYKYESKKWANAVLLTGEDTYKAGDTIEESKIKAYFVWIPKYSYKIFNMGNYTTNDATTLGSPQTINIKFGTTNTNDSNDGECTTVATSGQSGNCAVNKYMTHPAFISLGVKGIWVGKFETTGSISELTIQPNKATLRCQTVKSLFQAAYSYNRTLDSHMMKNTEWGAVAYLSHSKYGINNKVTINSMFKTGAGDYISNTNQSTTGNITGIYDMSGGAREYVAGYITNTLGDSGFSASDIELGSSYDKYFDRYSAPQNNYKDYNYRILGDATGELGPFTTGLKSSWYNDSAYFVKSSSPWFGRGGYSSVNGDFEGQFSFILYTGGANVDSSFRLVLD